MSLTRPRFWLLLASSLASAACDGEDLQLGAADAGAAGAEAAADAGAHAGEPGDKVFDPLRIASIQIEVSESDRELLRSEADKQINSDDFTYVSASVRFDGALLEQVGVRVKGNSSRRSSSDNPDAIPYKLDFNKYVKGQKLDALTKLNLHHNDSLNEYLSYGAFRNAGIAASRTGWAEVTLNGTSLGLYTLVEQVDEKMLARFYDDASGELYKPEPAAGYLNYSGADMGAYGDVGYKADKETDHATFLELVRTVNQDAVDAWDNVLDVNSVIEYFAGNVALGNWDTYVAMGHNYYLFAATTGRMVMLPWDLNLSQAETGVVCPADLSGGGPGGVRAGAGMPPEGFTPPQGIPPEGFTPPEGGEWPAGGPGGVFGQSEGTPLYTRLMESDNGFERYTQALKEFLQGPGSVEALNQAIDEVVPVLAERVSSSDIAALRAAITKRHESIATGLESTTSCAPASAK